MTLYVLSLYNEFVRYGEQEQTLLYQAEQEQQKQQQQQKHHHPDEEQQQRELQLLRKRQADVARLSARAQQLEAPSTTLVLTTVFGPIRVRLRPELSQGSVEYIYRLVESNVCQKCQFYRAETPGILQGIMANADIPTNTVLGTCPLDAVDVHNECPAWDPHCGCHGPVMTRGSVAWAAGQAGGPDFFINAYERPALWWGTQHTNFGFIEDPASMAIIDQIVNLPVTQNGGMHHLKEAIHFETSLE